MKVNRTSRRTDSAVKGKVLVVTPGKLGDSLISLVIPANFARAGFDVTVRGDCAHGLASWLPEVQTGPRLSTQEYNGIADEFDFCLIDSQAPGLQSGGVDLRPALSRRAVFFSLAHHDPSLDDRFDLLSLSVEKSALFRDRIPRRGLIRDKAKTGLTMVEHVVEFCRRELLLEHAHPDIGLVSPQTFEHEEQKRFIVISPTSGKARKNWRSARFVLLARQLHDIGHKCLFAVAPSESAEWRERLDGQFTLASTPTIAALAKLLSDAQALVCNDSGAGHLASALGTPVVAVIPRRDADYTWRPGWGTVKPVSPVLPLRALSGLWSYFVSVRQVRHSLEPFLNT
tara:strand:- start:895 stop:1920 length:1026 start_codon:yes stop_codon:yes gene_type:complete